MPSQLRLGFVFQIFICIFIICAGALTSTSHELSPEHINLAKHNSLIINTINSIENSEGNRLLRAPYLRTTFSLNSSQEYSDQPSVKVAAFYYPWYGNPETDQQWIHWQGMDFHPPLDISSDYYPVLGPYSSMDANVLSSHFQWLRRAKVGLIITSWWGQGSNEDQAIPLLLRIAEEWGIKVAFHIEAYQGRTAEQLLGDIKYIYSRYGNEPAFFRTTASSRWSPDERSKGLFFVWAISVREIEDVGIDSVEADYWRATMDAVHALPDGGIVIANITNSDWVDGGHFDGLYNYVTLGTEQPLDFDWAKGLPPNAWYVPSVIPGNSAQRIGYPSNLFVPRNGGATYDTQWEKALDTTVQPAMVTITSFNEWHEGTMIEPAAMGMENGAGYTYNDYSPLEPTGYLDLTRQWVERFLAWNWPVTYPVRVRLSTTADWTNFRLVSGGTWRSPELISASPDATRAEMVVDRLVLQQPLAQSETGNQVEMTMDLSLAFDEPEGTIRFEITKGYQGVTKVVFLDSLGSEILTMEWAGINPDDPNNSYTVDVPASVF